MERRYRLKRARWRFGLASVSLLLALAGLFVIAVAWPTLGAGVSSGFASAFIIAGAWLGLAGIASSTAALILCQHWHRHSVACGGAMAGVFAGAVVLGVSLVLLMGTGHNPPVTTGDVTGPPAFHAAGRR